MTAPLRGNDPLQRFVELANVLRTSKRGWFDWTILRHAALVLTPVAGSASALCVRLLEAGELLKQRAGWFGPLRSEGRFLVAALLLRQGDEVDDFLREAESARALLRSARVPRLGRGSLAETLAILLLRRQAPGGHVLPTQATRFQRIYQALRADHPFLTGRDDYPACALLCGSVRATEQIRAEIEVLYRELLRARFKRGQSLQAATHLLHLGGLGGAHAIERFQRLWQAFKALGLFMHSGDYDEIALLAALDASPQAITQLVTSQRTTIAALSPRPSRASSFTLAANTAFQALSTGAASARDLADFKAILDVQTVIRQKQAAAAAAAS